MGDPKKSRKKFITPSHPWQRARLEEENKLVKDYGLKNKREVWKSRSLQKTISDQAKSFIAETGPHADKLQNQLLSRLSSLNLVAEDAKLNDVLSLTITDFLERRLQTMVVRKGLAKTMVQSRQLITHKHIAIGNQKISVPSYLVKANEENEICFAQNSPFANLDHPERVQPKLEEKAPEDSAEEKPNKEQKTKKAESPKKKKKVKEEK